MDPSRWQRAKEIFFTALGSPAAERSKYLERACAGDAELYAEVASLLAAHQQDDDLVERSAFDALGIVSDEEHPEWIGRRLGGYRVVAALGRGGMSEVYRAVRDDDQFHKDVAVKVLRSGYDTESLLRRFAVEKQILATLDHPNIAHLLDAGSTEDELPYIVMDYVKGQPIDEYCNCHRLDVRARLELFLDLCDAVQYVHRHLMVHGDLKANNILVTDDGTVKLLDFGIAQLLGPAPAFGLASGKLTGFVALTPEYASPEQIRGEPIATTSDVYSLGVLLYRLLTGAMPYPANGAYSYELARQICEQQPERPSAAAKRAAGSARDASWQRRLAGDLDDIVLLALRKESERRYPSVEQLAADVRRYLDGFPVSARGSSAPYRLGKFVGRHRVSAAAGALFVLALLGGIATTSWQAHIATTQRARAERHFENVRKLADTFMFDVHDAIEDLSGATPARQMLVENSLKYLDALSGEAANDASLRRDLATAYEKVGDVQGGYRGANLGDADGALVSYRKALAIRTSLLDTVPHDADLRRELLSVNGKLSDLSISRGNAGEAIAYSQRAVELAKQLAAVAGATLADRRSLADAYLNLGYQLTKAEQVDRGLALMNEAADIYDSIVDGSIVDGSPEHGAARRNLALTHARIGEVLRDRPGAAADMFRAFEKAAAITGPLLAADSLNSDLQKIHAYTLLGMAHAQVRQGTVRPALDRQMQAVDMLRALSAADPKNEDARYDAAFALGEAADAFIALGELDDAERRLDEAIEILEASAAARLPELTGIRVLLGLDYFRIAKSHALRAAGSDVGADQRRHHCRSARIWFERSAPILEAAERDLFWRAEVTGRLAQAERELAVCNGV